MTTAEDVIRKRIQKKLNEAPKYYHYCSVCAGYLGVRTSFFKYIVHFKCRRSPVKFYNLPDNPPPSHT